MPGPTELPVPLGLLKIMDNLLMWLMSRRSLLQIKRNVNKKLFIALINSQCQTRILTSFIHYVLCWITLAIILPHPVLPLVFPPPFPQCHLVSPLRSFSVDLPLFLFRWIFQWLPSSLTSFLSWWHLQEMLMVFFFVCMYFRLVFLVLSFLWNYFRLFFCPSGTFVGGELKVMKSGYTHTTERIGVICLLTAHISTLLVFNTACGFSNPQIPGYFSGSKECFSFYRKENLVNTIVLFQRKTVLWTWCVDVLWFISKEDLNEDCYDSNGFCSS